MSEATYKPCLFDREAYLEQSAAFENLVIDYVEEELSEFNHDIESIAFELAYSRYRIAKLEKLLGQKSEVNDD